MRNMQLNIGHEKKFVFCIQVPDCNMPYIILSTLLNMVDVKIINRMGLIFSLQLRAQHQYMSMLVLTAAVSALISPLTMTALAAN